MKNAALILIYLTVTHLSFSQTALSGNVESTFPYEKMEDPKTKYPRLTTENNLWINPLVQMQGIKVSYLVDADVDRTLSIDMDRMEDWFIDVYLWNMTGEDIYYDNPDALVAYVKFPGENMDYTTANGREIEKTGGLCPFYANMLDKENGKYIFYAGEEYTWDYYVYRDTDSYIEAALQRKFRPLEVATFLPQRLTGESHQSSLREIPDQKEGFPSSV